MIQNTGRINENEIYWNKQVISQSQVQMIPVAPDFKKDEFYTKESLVNSIITVYQHICQNDQDLILQMTDTLFKSCKQVKPLKTKDIFIDTKCYTLATQFFLGIYLRGVNGSNFIDRRAGQILARFPVLQDMYYQEASNKLEGL